MSNSPQVAWTQPNGQAVRSRISDGYRAVKRKLAWRIVAYERADGDQRELRFGYAALLRQGREESFRKRVATTPAAPRA